MALAGRRFVGECWRKEYIVISTADWQLIRRASGFMDNTCDKDSRIR